jgi:uncharacterized protein YsxB (DUF464 family)
MIEVEILRDDEERVREIHCHAQEIAEESDEDKFIEIGISTLMRTAIIGLEVYLRLDPEVEDEDNKLILRLKRDQLLNREIDAILETMLLGFLAIQKRRPEVVLIKDAVREVNV